AHQWSMNFIKNQPGTLGNTLVGAWDEKGRRAELMMNDIDNNRQILVRGVWTKLSADAHDYEEDYSDDGGKTWKRSFVGHKTRIPASDVKPVAVTPNDFDFDIGTFRSHSLRLLNPLTGSTKWAETDGTTTVSR